MKAGAPRPSAWARLRCWAFGHPALERVWFPRSGWRCPRCGKAAAHLEEFVRDRGADGHVTRRREWMR